MPKPDDPMPLDLKGCKVPAGVTVRPIPWDIVRPHRQAAWDVRGETLERLRASGGIKPDEAVAILEDRPYRAMTDCAAFTRLAQLIKRAGPAS